MFVSIMLPITNKRARRRWNESDIQKEDDRHSTIYKAPFVNHPCREPLKFSLGHNKRTVNSVENCRTTEPEGNGCS